MPSTASTRSSTPRSAAAAVTVAAVVGGAGLRPDPAFAVARHADGDVVITVMRLSDADGLEQALAHEGITAEVEYDDTSNVSSDQDSSGSPACWPGVGDVVVDPADNGGITITLAADYVAAHEGVLHSHRLRRTIHRRLDWCQRDVVLTLPGLARQPVPSVGTLALGHPAG